jgi:hypothetical protein
MKQDTKRTAALTRCRSHSRAGRSGLLPHCRMERNLSAMDGAKRTHWSSVNETSVSLTVVLSPSPDP